MSYNQYVKAWSRLAPEAVLVPMRRFYTPYDEKKTGHSVIYRHNYLKNESILHQKNTAVQCFAIQ